MCQAFFSGILAGSDYYSFIWMYHTLYFSDINARLFYRYLRRHLYLIMYLWRAEKMFSIALLFRKSLGEGPVHLVKLMKE